MKSAEYVTGTFHERHTVMEAAKPTCRLCGQPRPPRGSVWVAMNTESGYRAGMMLLHALRCAGVTAEGVYEPHRTRWHEEQAKKRGCLFLCDLTPPALSHGRVRLTNIPRPYAWEARYARVVPQLLEVLYGGSAHA